MSDFWASRDSVRLWFRPAAAWLLQVVICLTVMIHLFWFCDAIIIIIMMILLIEFSVFNILLLLLLFMSINQCIFLCFTREFPSSVLTNAVRKLRNCRCKINVVTLLRSTKPPATFLLIFFPFTHCVTVQRKGPFKWHRFMRSDVTPPPRRYAPVNV